MGKGGLREARKVERRARLSGLPGAGGAGDATVAAESRGFYGRETRNLAVSLRKQSHRQRIDERIHSKIGLKT